MPITRTDFESIDDTDLLELVTAGSAEGFQLEFKRETYGGSDAEKREFLKDISAFANTHGGHLVIGIRETNGVASELTGFSCSDIDAEATRLGQIARGGLEPYIQGLILHKVPMTNGMHAIVIRVPKSWRAPHRVSAQGSNRFWLRNSSGCHEASMDELRALFGQSAGALEAARQFRNERVAMIQRSEGARPLVGEGRLIFHLIPQSALLSSDSFDVLAIYNNHSAFSPLGSMSMSPRFNFEGVINERGGDLNHGYTQIFRNGIVEATKGRILRTGQRGLGIPGQGLEQHLFERLDKYIDGLKALGVQPPIILMLTLEGIRGARYFVNDSLFEDQPMTFDRDTLYLPDCLLTTYGSIGSYHAVIRPAIDALWNAVGHAQSRFFSEVGMWTGRFR